MPLRWTDRHFTFNLPEELFPVVVERLRGTPARIEDKVRGLSREALTRRDGEAWSIQEHIGHLLDLDELHTGRLDDFLAGAAVLRAADMTNRKTHEAGHNLRPIAELLGDFRRERESFVARLDAWDPALVSLTGLHPRLQQPMRVIDLAFFTAEHDDHHLTRMSELKNIALR
ncbi:MAG TPA: DinB family protein [Thermoanaerobaculia bacterium]|nr:DinB family protein [Thermoanaerobaculia bacterium]